MERINESIHKSFRFKLDFCVILFYSLISYAPATFMDSEESVWVISPRSPVLPTLSAAAASGAEGNIIDLRTDDRPFNEPTPFSRINEPLLFFGVVSEGLVVDFAASMLFLE